MASKRGLRRRRCGRKVHYATRENALAAKFRMPRGRELDAYRCPFCGEWALGHRPGSSNTPNKRVLRGDRV